MKKFKVNILILICVIVVMTFGLLLTLGHESVSTRQQKIRVAMRNHDWSDLVKLIPPLDLQGASLKPDVLHAFLTHYASRLNSLELHQNPMPGGIRFEYTFPNERSKMSVFSIVVSRKRGPIPFLPPDPDVRPNAFAPTYAAIALSEFPGLDQLSPRRGTPLYTAAQYLIARRDKEFFQSIGLPCYSHSEDGVAGWDKEISVLAKHLIHEGWDIAKLERSYKMGL